LEDRIMSTAVQFKRQMLVAAAATLVWIAAPAQSVNLTFDVLVPGTLADATGNGTGFTTRLPGTGSALPPNDPNLFVSNGTLAITSTQTQIGSFPSGWNIASVPCQSWIAQLGDDATATIRYQGLPPLGANVATGIFVGSSNTEYVMYILTEQGFIGMSSTGAPAQSWAAYSSPGVFSANDSVDISLSRSGNTWIGTWNNITTNQSGTTGPQLPGYLTGAHNLFVGVFAFSPNIGSTPFVVNVDSFVFTAPCSPPPSNSPGGLYGPNTVPWLVSAGGNGHAYEVVNVACSGITWTDAHAAAVSAGGHLATPTTPAENAFVFSLLQPQHFAPNGSGPHLGGVQPAFGAEPSSDWRWTTGEPWTWSNWAPGEPNNGSNEDRLQFANVASPGLWNDMSADATARAYIVEYEPTLPCTPPVGSAFTLCAAHNAAGDARLQIFNLPTDTLYGKILISTAAATPLGSGSFFGLNADLFTLTVLLAPPQIGDPLSWWSTEPGLFPDAPYLFPPGLMLPFAGTTWDLVAVAVTTTGTIHFSNFVQNTW
jgi:hypothetical protein